MTTYLFPGQGSQAKGMGAKLFDKFPAMTDLASDILGYSIKSLCTQNLERRLNNTEFTQPALYVVNALSYQNMLSDPESIPQYLAGHSLGEYNALQAAGVISFEAGLKLVQKRGELMSRAPAGSMAAIVGLTYDEVSHFLASNNLSSLDIANANAPKQIVISGQTTDISAAKRIFENVYPTGVNYVPLNVSGAFHSRYMVEAKEEFNEFLKAFEFSMPKIPVIANVTGQPYQFENIAQMLVEQITSPVLWTNSIRYILEQGEIEFKEVGPGNVLTKLLNYIKTDWNANHQFTESAFDKTESQSKNQTIDNSSITVSYSASTKNSIANNKTEADHYKDKIIQLTERIKKWNNIYPIGTKVHVKGYDETLETRTEAMMLFGHRGAIYMLGYKGYFALDDVIPVAP